MNIKKVYIAFLFSFSVLVLFSQTKERIKEVPFTKVRLTDCFWAPRMETNRTVSIPSAFKECEKNGRFDNFALAGGLIKGEHKGDFSFDDTDPYKVIEGASYSLAVKYDAALDAYLDSVITIIAAAQEPDGYLCTCVTNRCERLSGWWGHSRWEKINSHELYNCGHLYEAAVAHFQATGKRTLLNVAIKNADLICTVFGPEEGKKHVPSGHPIVEMALAKLYKVTGKQEYLALAKYFVEETGRGTDGHILSAYSQDHQPILQQEEIVGHAVRAGYLYSGVADVAALTQDTAYFHALCRIWENMAGKKLYITGGIGSRAQGEGFGPNYELNNHTAYCETCAAIANVYWNHRMFLATGEAKYADVVERALYNGVISGVSLSGDKFFYDNPLESMGQHGRQKWFGCACCPGNITRFMASIPYYIYATQKNSVYVNMYAQGEATIELENNEIRMEQTTAYPYEGRITLKVTPKKKNKWTLRLRIPGWAQSSPVPSDLYRYTDAPKPYKLYLNGEEVKGDFVDGYAVFERKWKAGDEVTLVLPMEVRRVSARQEVVDDRGKLAMERGPIVYCLEGKDQADGTVFNKYIPAGTQMEAKMDTSLLGGVMVLTGVCKEVARDGSEKEVPFKAVPYATWNNRGADQMAVWIPEEAAYTRPTPLPTIASRARTLSIKAPIQKDAPESASVEEWAWGVNDQWEPKCSADNSKPYYYWWLKQGTLETLAYEFDRPEHVSSVEVYWLDFDHYDGNYRVPESWKLYYKEGNAWKEVETLDEYGIKKDCYNVLHFKPVMTSALKIEAQLRKGASGGIIEWKVNGEPYRCTERPVAMPKEMKQPSFYKKYLNQEGFPIVASANVRDEALMKAYEYMHLMLLKLPAAREAMIQRGCKVIVIGEKEQVSDIPEYAFFTRTAEEKKYWNARARGFGGSEGDGWCMSGGEENLLNLPGDRYRGENIFIHEFAHLIHGVGLRSTVPGFDDRLQRLYDSAKTKGLWANTYAMANKEEYFAECVQSYFNCNRYAEKADGIHNSVNTREKLRHYDPEMYALLSELFY